MKPRSCKILRARGGGAAAQACGHQLRSPAAIFFPQHRHTCPLPLSSAQHRSRVSARAARSGGKASVTHTSPNHCNQLLDQPACHTACHTAPRGAARRNDHTHTRTAPLPKCAHSHGMSQRAQGGCNERATASMAHAGWQMILRVAASSSLDKTAGSTPGNAHCAAF